MKKPIKRVSKLVAALLCFVLLLAIAIPPLSKASFSGGAMVVETSFAPGSLQSAVETEMAAASATDLTQITSLSFAPGVATNLNATDFAYIQTNLTSLKTLNMSNVSALTTIPANALSFSGLQTVQLPAVTTTIEQEAFRSCTSLQTINLGSVTTIGSSSFSGTELGEVDIANVTSLGTYAFIYCRNLTIKNGALNSNLTTIPNYAFSVCKALETVDLSHVTTLGNNAFADCPKLINVDLSAVTSLGEYAFYLCSKLTIANNGALNPNLATISNGAFHSCAALTQIDLSNVTTVGKFAFVICASLDNVDLSNVTTIQEAGFYGCSSLGEVDLSTVTTLEGYAFMNCTSMTIAGDGALNPTLTTIEPSTFTNCASLDKVNLANVTTVKANAFQNCVKLYDTVQWNAGPITFEPNAFAKCALDFSVSYPNGMDATSVTTYAPNQSPKVFFSLQYPSQTINAGDAFNNTPWQIKTLYGTTYADIIGTVWTDAALTTPAVTSNPASIDTNVGGTYPIRYSIDASRYADNHNLDFTLYIIGNVPPPTTTTTVQPITPTTTTTTVSPITPTTTPVGPTTTTAETTAETTTVAPVEPSTDTVTTVSTQRQNGGTDWQQQRQNTLNQLKEEDVPILTIGDAEIPLYGPVGSDTWALMNLLLAIATVVLSIVMLIMHFTGKEKNDSDEQIKRKGMWRIASLIPAAIAIIAFLLTEDMRNLMVLVDIWTILMAVILAAQIVIMVMTKKSRRNKDSNQPQPQQS